MFSEKKLNKVNFSPHTFVTMDEIPFTPLEAWDDFYQNFERVGRTPNEISVAEHTRRGRNIVNGKPKTLGAKRIRRLLDKYAPGKYQYHEGNPYFTK